MTIDFGELKRIDLRALWSNEATAFTPWLCENLPALGKALGMELELEDREADCGDFSLDILAKDLGTGRRVVIENQLTVTNHDHLGKLITYAAGFDASVVIWISEAIREEHRQALEWLNRRTDSETDFFGVVVEAFQIDSSRPVFNFKPVVYPNEWQKTRRRIVPPPSSSRGEAYRAYFQPLLDELREKHRFTGARAAQPQNWYSFASGVTGAVYSTSFNQGGRVRAEVYLDVGDGEENERWLEWLRSDKDSVERAFGEPLEWEPLEDRRACRIACYRDGTIDSDQATLESIRGWAISRLLKLKSVFGPRLKKYASEHPRAATSD